MTDDNVSRVVNFSWKIPHPPVGSLKYKNIMECIVFNTAHTELMHIAIESLTHGAFEQTQSVYSLTLKKFFITGKTLLIDFFDLKMLIVLKKTQ